MAGWDMGRTGHSLSRRLKWLFAILLTDGALLGAMMGIVHVQTPIEGLGVAAPAGEQKLVALTFDDGPHEIYTEQLLDGLKERQVPATFFLMGQNIRGKEALVKRMQQEGHLIGNHSYAHLQLTKSSEDAVCQSIEKTEEMISEITGTRPQYLRPPYGDWNDSLECRMNLTTVFWTVDSVDWKLQNTDQIVRHVMKKMGTNEIILMHDIFPTSVESALQIIDLLKSQGYTFVTVDEMMID